MGKRTAKELSSAAEQFCTDGKMYECEPYGNGHINDTFLMKCRNESGETVSYIMQAVNTNVFREPEKLMDNIYAVTEFLKKSETDPRKVLTLVKTLSGDKCYFDKNGTCFRVYPFITDSICLERPESADDFYECAYAFGKFQRDLGGFKADTLYEVIPDFHNTPKRYENFLSAVKADKLGRAREVSEEIEFLKARADFYGVLTESCKKGILPLRVTHNDTKSNNVLLDAKTRKALCVIDLDTIMPGFSVTDFGDSIRFGASTAAEDEKDLSKVSLDLDLFAAYADGYLAGCGGALEDSEIMLLPEGAMMMTVECGMRFLTDYLEGDTYFKIAYSDHNLVRCRTQLTLVKDMEDHLEDMKNIVKKYCRK